MRRRRSACDAVDYFGGCVECRRRDSDDSDPLMCAGNTLYIGCGADRCLCSLARIPRVCEVPHTRDKAFSATHDIIEHTFYKFIDFRCAAGVGVRRARCSLEVVRVLPISVRIGGKAAGPASALAIAMASALQCETARARSSVG